MTETKNVTLTITTSAERAAEVLAVFYYLDNADGDGDDDDEK